MRLAKRQSRLGTENAFEVLGQIKELEAKGRKILSFAIGEPDFDTPEHIKKAGMKAIEQNYTHYGPSPGIPELRKAIAQEVSRTRGIKALPEEVVVTPGAKPIIFFTMLTLVEEGDEVIYPNPGYPIYESMIDYCGGTGIPMELVEEKDFSFDLEHLRKKITDKTKLIIINSPQNPTGGVIPHDDLEGLAKLCVEHDIMVLSDEIYSRVIYDTKFESIAKFPGMKERTIILDGHSKIFSMTGWRLGYGVMNKELAWHMGRLMTNSVAHTSTFVQIAGVEAIEGSQKECEMMVKEFHERRDLIVDLLNDIPGVSCHKPLGAFYVFPNVTRLCKERGFKDSEDVREYLLNMADVAVLSRMHFGRKNVGEIDEYIRLSYATSKKHIKEGLATMKQALTDDEKIKRYLEQKRGA